MEVEEAIKMLQNYCTRRDCDFYNLVVQDKIEICTLFISCFETRSRICSIKSQISRRGLEIKNTENHYITDALA